MFRYQCVIGSLRSFDLELTFVNLVVVVQLNVGPDMDMKEVGRLVEEQGIQISWSVVSKRMGNRSRLSCFKKWQKMSGVIGNLMGDVDVDPHHSPHHNLHHHDAGLMKRGRRGGDDDDDDGEDEDDDFSGLHGDPHHPLAGGAPPNKRSKIGEKIEFPQAATAGAAAALAHQHTAQQQHHQHQQLQHFNHHHPTHMGMTGTALQQQQPTAALSPPQPVTTTTTTAAASASAAANSSSLSNPFRNVVQPTNEVYFDASQAEAIMEAVKLPDPGRLK